MGIHVLIVQFVFGNRVFDKFCAGGGSMPGGRPADLKIYRLLQVDLGHHSRRFGGPEFYRAGFICVNLGCL